MVVTVAAFGDLRQYLPGGTEKSELQIPEGTTVGGLVEFLAIPPGKFWFATVAGRKVQDDYRLSDDEEITLFNPVGGG